VFLAFLLLLAILCCCSTCCCGVPYFASVPALPDVFLSVVGILSASDTMGDFHCYRTYISGTTGVLLLLVSLRFSLSILQFIVYGVPAIEGVPVCLLYIYSWRQCYCWRP
jgi:hypothetical protein